jgi:hypothetical protein
LLFLYNQGVARVPHGWILSGTDLPLPETDRIVRTDEHLHVLLTNNPAIPPTLRARGYDHVGDIDVVGHTIYAPLEQPDYSTGHQVTAMYDARTLLFKGSVTLPQHQNSFVTIDPKTLIAYTQDEFGGRYLRRYAVDDHWRRLPGLRMSQALHHTQGADIARGAIWISTSDSHNDIWRVGLHSGRVEHLGTHRHPGGEGEGIDASVTPTGSLHTLIADPTNRTVMWFENFGLVTASASPQGSTGRSTGSPGSAPGVTQGSGQSGTGEVPFTGFPGRLALVGLLAIAAGAGLWRGAASSRLP